LFELIEASRRVHRFNAMSFSMRQQKLDKFCRGYKVLRPRLTKHCRGRVPGVPGGVDAYGVYVCPVSYINAPGAVRGSETREVGSGAARGGRGKLPPYGWTSKNYATER